MWKSKIIFSVGFIQVLRKHRGGGGGGQPIAYIGLQGGGGSQELVKNGLRNTWTVPYQQNILNVKTELPMWYNIFLKGFLTSIYHSNNCHNYHYDCHYCPYYHLTCHHHHQNVNYYAQINIHIKTPVLCKVPKQRKWHFLVILYPYFAGWNLSQKLGDHRICTFPDKCQFFHIPKCHGL